MRLNDKIQFVSEEKTITCTATFCYLKGKKKPGVFWVDEDFCYWAKKYFFPRKWECSPEKSFLAYKPDFFPREWECS